MRFGSVASATLVASIGWAAADAGAHDFRIGAIVIDHPYAVTSAPGSNRGEVYFRALKNTGTQPDRLTGARTSIAGSARVQRQTITAAAAADAADAIDLPAGSEVRVRHDGPWQVQLTGLQAPLRKRDSFTLMLRFEHAGEIEVPVTVELPRPSRMP